MLDSRHWKSAEATPTMPFALDGDGVSHLAQRFTAHVDQLRGGRRRACRRRARPPRARGRRAGAGSSASLRAPPPPSTSRRSSGSACGSRSCTRPAPDGGDHADAHRERRGRPRAARRALGPREGERARRSGKLPVYVALLAAPGRPDGLRYLALCNRSCASATAWRVARTGEDLYVPPLPSPPPRAAHAASYVHHPATPSGPSARPRRNAPALLTLPRLCARAYSPGWGGLGASQPPLPPNAPPVPHRSPRAKPTASR